MMSSYETTYNPLWRADTPLDVYPHISIESSDEESLPWKSSLPDAYKASTPAKIDTGLLTVFLFLKSNFLIGSVSYSSNDRFPSVPLTDVDAYNSDEFDCTINPNAIEDNDDRRLYIIEREQILRCRAQENDAQFKKKLRLKGEKALARDCARRQKLDEVRRIAAGRCTLPPPTPHQWPLPESSDPGVIQRAETINEVFAQWAEINQPDDLFDPFMSNHVYSKEESLKTANEIITALGCQNDNNLSLTNETIDRDFLSPKFSDQEEDPIVKRYFNYCGHLWQSEGSEDGDQVITYLRCVTDEDLAAFNARQDSLYSATDLEVMNFELQLCMEQYDVIEKLGYYEPVSFTVDKSAEIWTLSLLTGKHYYNEVPPSDELEKDRLIALDAKKCQKVEPLRQSETLICDYVGKDAAEDQQSLFVQLMNEISSDDNSDDDKKSCSFESVKNVDKDLTEVKAESFVESDSDNYSSTDDSKPAEVTISTTTVAVDIEAELTASMEVDNPEPLFEVASSIIETVASEVHTAIKVHLSPSPALKSPLRLPVVPNYEHGLIEQLLPPLRKSPSVIGLTESLAASPIAAAVETELIIEPTEVESIEEQSALVQPIPIEPALPPPFVAISLETAIPFDNIPNPVTPPKPKAPFIQAKVVEHLPSPVCLVPPPPLRSTNRVLKDFGPPLRFSDRKRRENWRQPLYATLSAPTAKPKSARRKPLKPNKIVKPALKSTPKTGPKSKSKPAVALLVNIGPSTDESDHRRLPSTTYRTSRRKPMPLEQISVVPLRRSTRQRKPVDRYGASGH